MARKAAGSNVSQVCVAKLPPNIYHACSSATAWVKNTPRVTQCHRAEALCFLRVPFRMLGVHRVSRWEESGLAVRVEPPQLVEDCLEEALCASIVITAVYNLDLRLQMSACMLSNAMPSSATLHQNASAKHGACHVQHFQEC